MRRKEKLIQEVAEINDIIAKGEVVRVAMISDGEPYVVPMSYGYREGSIYLHCASEGRKVDAMRANPSVCFEISCDLELIKKGQACGWTYGFRSVIGRGTVAFVEDAAEKLDGLSAIMEQYGSSEHSFSDSAVSKTEVLRIDISEMTGKQSPLKN